MDSEKKCPRCGLPMRPEEFFPGYWECAARAVWLEVADEEDDIYDEDSSIYGRTIYGDAFALMIASAACSEIERLRDDLKETKREFQAQFDKGMEHQRSISGEDVPRAR